MDKYFLVFIFLYYLHNYLISNLYNNKKKLFSGKFIWSKSMKQAIYVSSYKSKQIHVWKIDKNGKLILLQELRLPYEVQPIKISYDGRHLYVGVHDYFAIITYLISDELKISQQAVTTIQSPPTYIEIDHYCRWLFIPSYHKGNLMVLPIDKHGIARSPIQLISNLKYPHSSKINFDNSMLFVPCLGGDHIRIYKINNDGYLTEDTDNKITTNKGSGPRHMVFSLNQNTFYCLNELDATINVYSKFKTYQQTQSCKILPIGSKIKPWASDIHITPNGRHLYASERSSSIIRHFKITKDGLKLLPMAIYSTENQPRGFDIDQNGIFLLVAGQKSNHIIVYKIDRITGALYALDRYPVGINPMWITTNLIKN